MQFIQVTSLWKSICTWLETIRHPTFNFLNNDRDKAWNFIVLHGKFFNTCIFKWNISTKGYVNVQPFLLATISVHCVCIETIHPILFYLYWQRHGSQNTIYDIQIHYAIIYTLKIYSCNQLKRLRWNKLKPLEISMSVH